MCNTAKHFGKKLQTQVHNLPHFIRMKQQPDINLKEFLENKNVSLFTLHKKIYIKKTHKFYKIFL